MRPVVVWHVAAGDGGLVADIVRLVRADPGARVVVNGRPADARDPVEPGDHVELWPARTARSLGEVRLVAQRDGIVVAFKPAGLPTETTPHGSDSVVSALLKLLGGGKIHAASRLDVQVSGLLLCTLGHDAARRVAHWRERGQLRRRYVALSDGRVDIPPSGTWDEPLGRRRDAAGRQRAEVARADGRAARTRYEIVLRTHQAVLLSLCPETGRMHQLRAHAAHAGLPLLGDRLYGGVQRLTRPSGAIEPLRRIALQCVSVELPGLECEVPADDAMQSLWLALGGERWPG